MTMQVGMVGTDGVLIASDTKVMNNITTGPSEQSYLPRQTEDESRKIIINHKRGIAISLAKSTETADRVAKAVFVGLKDEEFAYPCKPIQLIGKAVLEEIRELELTRRWIDKEAHCLIALAYPSPNLYLFRFDIFGVDYAPICKPVGASIVVGDHANAALFWKERYYGRRPIKKLVPLAAHLIVSASKLNLAAIKGLDIVLCDASGPHRIAKKSIRELKTQANTWDKHIGSLFANYRQDYTFAPKEAG